MEAGKRALDDEDDAGNMLLGLLVEASEGKKRRVDEPVRVTAAAAAAAAPRQPQQAATPQPAPVAAPPVEPPQPQPETPAVQQPHQQAPRVVVPSATGPLIGRDGEVYVRNMLQKHGPNVTIPELQTKHGLSASYDKWNGGVLVLRLTRATAPAEALPVCELLDMHGVKRSALYTEIAAAFRDKLIPRLETLSPAQLNAMLEKTFPYISIEELGAVPLAVMMRMPEVKSQYLVELARHKDLYEKCPMAIKRQIWAVDKALFLKQVTPLLRPYFEQAAADDATFNEMWAKARDDPRERRHATPVLQTLLQYIDRSVDVYKAVVDMCVRLYREEAHPLMCALRADVLMTLHDEGIALLYSADPCHEFAWILDAAVKAGTLSDAQLRDLAAATSKLHPRDSLLDQAMLVANPPALHMVLRSMCLALSACVGKRVLPHSVAALQQLCALLHLGVMAKHRVRGTPVGSPSVHSILRVVSPWLAGILVDAQLATDVPDGSDAPPELLETCQREPAARRLVQAFAAMQVNAGEPCRLRTLLALCMRSFDASEDMDFVQSIVSNLMNQPQQRAATPKWVQTQQACMDVVLQDASKYGLGAHQQAMRFLRAFASRLPVSSALAFLRRTIDSAADADHLDGQLQLKYIDVLGELLMPNKAEESDVEFVTNWLRYDPEATAATATAAAATESSTAPPAQ